MLLLVPVLLLLAQFPVSEAKEPVRLQGHGFAFQLVEPSGWVLDFESAAQIANFVITPAGTSWRQSDVTIFARFNRKRPGENLDEFVRQDVDQFEENCPLFEVRDIGLHSSGVHTFVGKAYSCPGARHEVVATTDVPGFFITFVLSARSKDLIPQNLTPFKQVLSSFVWESAPLSWPRPLQRMQ